MSGISDYRKHRDNFVVPFMLLPKSDVRTALVDLHPRSTETEPESHRVTGDSVHAASAFSAPVAGKPVIAARIRRSLPTVRLATCDYLDWH